MTPEERSALDAWLQADPWRGSPRDEWTWVERRAFERHMARLRGWLKVRQARAREYSRQAHALREKQLRSNGLAVE